MATYIKTLSDSNGDLILPRTRTDAITTTDGENIETKINSKSTVTASSTGTSTTEANYLTIDGTEWKLSGGSGGGYVLPVATESTLGGIKSGTDITVDASGNVSVNDDSHNHIISNIDGLQDALDTKITNPSGGSTGQVLTKTASGSEWTDVSGGSTPDLGTISVGTTWTGSGPYTQTVTVTGATVTANSKIDVQPSAEQIVSFVNLGVNALLIENDNGTLTLKFIGAHPTTAMTMQVLVTEVTL